MFEHKLKELNVKHNTAYIHQAHNGKVERSHKRSRKILL